MRWVSEPAARSILPVGRSDRPPQLGWRPAPRPNVSAIGSIAGNIAFRKIGKHQQQTHSLFITNNVISDENIDQYIAMWRLNGIVDSH